MNPNRRYFFKNLIQHMNDERKQAIRGLNTQLQEDNSVSENTNIDKSEGKRRKKELSFQQETRAVARKLQN